MRYTLATVGVVLPATARRQIEEKVGRLAKHLRHPLPIEITMRREGKGLIMCGITYGEGKRAIHAERSNRSIEGALDDVLEVFRREIIEQRERARVQG